MTNLSVCVTIHSCCIAS